MCVYCCSFFSIGIPNIRRQTYQNPIRYQEHEVACQTMNLLIEQRPTTITSKIQQKLTKNNDVNNSLSPPSSPLILKIKRQTANQQTDLDSTSLPMINEDNNNNNSRLTTHNQRLKRPVTTNQTTTRRPSSPAFNGKQQQQQQTVTKRSVTIDNNNNDLNPTMDENSSKKRFKQDDLNVS